MLRDPINTLTVIDGMAGPKGNTNSYIVWCTLCAFKYHFFFEETGGARPYYAILLKKEVNSL
jgi:hypothetical protein